MGKYLRQAVLLDEHPLWLEAVDSLLRGVEIEVMGKASTAESGLALLAELRPSLFITEIDLKQSEPSGADLLRRARAEVPGLRTIVLSQRDEADMIATALSAGATAYVVKTAHPDDLAAAVRQAFGQSLYFAASAHGVASPVPDEDMPLTRREREILALVAEGQSNAQLARALWVTEQTVKFHLSNIYRKLDVANRTQASRWAQLHGLVAPVAEPAPNGAAGERIEALAAGRR